MSIIFNLKLFLETLLFTKAFRHLKHYTDFFGRLKCLYKEIFWNVLDGINKAKMVCTREFFDIATTTHPTKNSIGR